MRRPLYLAAFLLLLIYLGLPPGLWMHTKIQEGSAVFTGTVGRREQKEGMQVYYLKDTSISEARWILVYLKESKSQYFIGNTLQVYGTIKTYEQARNPGQFDSLAYYQTRKIDAMCFAQRIDVVDGRKDALREAFYQLKLQWCQELERWLGTEEGGVLEAMLLGERSALPKTAKALLERSGLSHILSQSGLHISILGMGLYRMLRKTGLSYGAAGIPAGILMGCYGILIGAGVSALRALTMFLLAVGADLLGRAYDIRTALAVAAIWLMLEQPLYARDGAFLLSFGAVFGLTEVGPVVRRLLTSGEADETKADKMKAKKTKAGRTKTLEGICASLSIQVVTLPIVMRCFCEVPVYSPVLNLLVLPWMPGLLTSGLFCMLVGWASAWSVWPVWSSSLLQGAARLAAWICRGIWHLVEFAAGASGYLPGAVYCTGAPKLWQIGIYYAGVAGLLVGWRIWNCRNQQRFLQRGSSIQADDRISESITGKSRIVGRWLHRKWKFCFLGGYAVCLCLLLLRTEPEFTMTMLDVGQGDAIYVKTRGGNTFLIDGGSSSEEQIGTYILEPFLKYQGQDRVDYWLVSHGDEDHISGIREVIENRLLEVGCLILPKAGMILETAGEERGRDTACLELEALAQETGIPVLWMEAGDHLQDGKLWIRCLGPESGTAYESKNAASMVLHLEYENLRILLTGDLEGAGEQRLLSRELLLDDYDILKVAHHGSKYSTGEAFLLQVQPKISLISCDEKNSYGHPHEELLDRLELIGSRVYMTPQSGAVTVISDGKVYKVRTMS